MRSSSCDHSFRAFPMMANGMPAGAGGVSQPDERFSALNAEIALQKLRSRLDLAGRSFVGDMAVVDDVGALRQRQRGSEILLDQHDGLPGVGQLAADLDEIAYDHRR